MCGLAGHKRGIWAKRCQPTYNVSNPMDDNQKGTKCHERPPDRGVLPPPRQTQRKHGACLCDRSGLGGHDHERDGQRRRHARSRAVWHDARWAGGRHLHHDQRPRPERALPQPWRRHRRDRRARPHRSIRRHRARPQNLAGIRDAPRALRRDHRPLRQPHRRCPVHAEWPDLPSDCQQWGQHAPRRP
jgi:hypothetical protein